MQQTELQLFRAEMLRHVNRMFEAFITADDASAIGTAMYEACWLKARLETHGWGSPSVQDVMYNQLANGLIEARHQARVEASKNRSIGRSSVPDTTNG